MTSDYKMLSEIKEQPGVIKQLLDREHDAEIMAVIEEIQNALNRDGQIYLVGSGSSYHSALFGSHLFAKSNFFISTAVQAGDFDTYVPDLQSNDLIIFISQSGSNPTILELFYHFAQRSVKTIVITNEIDSPMAHRVDNVLPLEIKREEAVPATKTYLAELVILSMISEGLKDGAELFRVKEEISGEIDLICQQNFYNRMNTMAQFLVSSTDIFVLGEGIEYANAEETALKFQECASVNIKAYPLDEFLHGPVTMVKKNTPVILFNTNLDQKSEPKIEKIKQTGGVVIYIGGKKKLNTDALIPVKDFGLFTGIVSIVPLQLLVYKTAIMKGLDPDKPRGLNKIVKY